MFVAALLWAIAGCAVNPVTGERDFILVSEAQELAIGAQQYAPSQQLQGGSYELDPELTRYVQGVGQRLAAVSDRQLPYEFVVLNNSVPNAWALPGGKIAVNRGLLLELNSEAELAAVLGHEIVHAAARHSAQQLSRAQLAQIAQAGVMVGAVAYGGRDSAELLAGATQVGAQLMLQRYGRDAERESDRFGMVYMKRAGYDPIEAVSLQRTFLRLSEGRQANWLEGLFQSHPPSAERVANNQASLAEIGAGGAIEREAYQRAIARLKRTKPAYDAFEQGRKALREGRAADAERLAREALRGEPREALFHALVGDIAQQRGDLTASHAAYDQAIRLNDRMFLYPLGRGLLRLKMGNRAGGRTDLETSVRLLPTPRAMNELGKLALEGGDARVARGYFEGAASAQGPVGDEARVQLARIDLGADPSKVLRVRAFVDGGQLGMELANPSAVAAQDVVIEFLARANPGAPVQRSERVVRVLRAGERVLVPSGLVVGENPETQVRIVSARPLESS